MSSCQPRCRNGASDGCTIQDQHSQRFPEVRELVGERACDVHRRQANGSDGFRLAAPQVRDVATQGTEGEVKYSQLRVVEAGNGTSQGCVGQAEVGEGWEGATAGPS